MLTGLLKRLPIISNILLAIIVMIFVYSSSAFAAVNITLEPSADQGKPGDIITVDLAATGLEELFGAQFLLQFDPAVLKAVTPTGAPATRVTGGDVFRGSLFTARNIINSSTGTVEYAVTYLGDHAGYTGSGVIFSLNFEVLQHRETEIAIHQAKLVNRDHSLPPIAFNNMTINKGVREQTANDSPVAPPVGAPGTPPADPTTPTPVFDTVELATPEGNKHITTINPEALKTAIDELVQTGAETFVLKLPEQKNEDAEIDSFGADVPLEALSLMLNNNLGLQIMGGRTIINIPLNSIKDIISKDSDLNVEIWEIDQPEELENITKQLHSKYSDSSIHGRPLGIDTNLSGRVQLSLRFDEVSLPGDEAARKAFLQNLAIFIIHGDGDERVLAPETVKVTGEKTVELTFWLDRFSSFILVELPEGALKTSGLEIKLQIGSLEALLGGQMETLDAAPFINPQVSRTLVPLRFISEGLGAGVQWLEEKREVHIEDDGKIIILTIDSETVLVDGEPTELDCPAIIKEIRTFVPLRFISKTLGADVQWHEATQEITISR